MANDTPKSSSPFYEGLFEIDGVHEHIRRSLGKAATVDETVLFIQEKLLPNVPGAWSYAREYTNDIFCKVARNFSLADNQLAPLVDIFRKVVPMTRAFLETTDDPMDSMTRIKGKIAADIQAFEKLSPSKISEIRRAAFEECIAIIKEHFSSERTSLILDNPRSRLLDPSSRVENLKP